MKLITVKKMFSVIVVSFFCFNQMAFADDAQLLSLVKQMQKQMTDMQKTIDQQSTKIMTLESRQKNLELRPSSETAPASAAEATPPMSDYEFNERLANATGGANKWLKDLKFGGDLRLRYEAFENHSGSPSENDDRNRFRYRLRYGFEKKFNDEMKIGFAMASGESSAGTQVDPTSTNTTFDNNFNFKDIFIEKAFATYNPNFAKIGPVKNLELTAGKFTNPFERGSSDIIWDRDVKPEGVYEKIDFNPLTFGDTEIGSYFTAGQFVLDEDGTDKDAELFAYQVGINPVFYTPLFERPVDFLSAASLYAYNDYADRGNFQIGTTSLARGNTVCGTGTTTGLFLCTQDFEILDFYNEIAFYPNGLPVRPYYDFAVNNKAYDDDGQAFALGVKLGGIVKKGDWQIDTAYKRVERNAVPGFNDSDFGYSGHSGKRGYVLKLAYALTDNIQLNLAGFFVNNLTTGTGFIDEEQRRFQVDLVWKF